MESSLQATDDNPLIREGNVLSRRSPYVYTGVTEVVAGLAGPAPPRSEAIEAARRVDCAARGCSLEEAWLGEVA